MFTTHERSTRTHDSSHGHHPIAERIVLAIDFLEESETALRWTLDRARGSSVFVDVVTVVKVDSIHRDAVIEDDRVSAQNALDHATSVLHGVVDAGSLRTEMYWGSTARGILDASEDADLLVVGTQNATRNPVFHHPSIAARLTTVGHTDLVVVPDGWMAPPSGPVVVVGISGDPEDRVTVAAAAREAERLGARLELVHSWDRPSATAVLSSGLAIDLTLYEDTHREMLATAMTEAAESFPNVVITGSLTEKSASHALRDASEHASLLVVGSHGTSAADRFFMGSTSHAVVTAPRCPVLIVRSRKRSQG